MNQLQVKTIELEPAKVVFNHEEIKKDLDKSLKKYSGLTFTEDDATECRSTISELRKGKKAVDQYRIKTKKELTEPVAKFENKCKSLNKKFDEGTYHVETDLFCCTDCYIKIGMPLNTQLIAAFRLYK